VTLDGQPVAGALLVFIADDERKETPLTTQSNDKGEYRLIGNTGAGVPVGKYKIAVSKLALQDGTVPATKEQLKLARAQDLLGNILPKIYEDRATTPCSVKSAAAPTRSQSSSRKHLDIGRHEQPNTERLPRIILALRLACDILR